MQRLFLVMLLLSASASVAAAQPSFSAEFSPSTIGPGAGATLRFVITNADTSPVQDLAFTNDLPAGLMIGADPAATSDCSGAVVSTAAGASSFGFSAGRVGAAGSCEISVNVVAVSGAGTYMNVSNALTSSAGDSGSTSASLTVDLARPGFTLQLTPDTVGFGGKVRATYTIDNSANAGLAFNLSFTHTLPSGVRVADSPQTTTDCNGTLTASPGADSVTFAGGFLLNGASCQIALDLRVSSTGLLGLSTSSLSSSAGSCGLASALITVPVDKLRLQMALQDAIVAPGATTSLQLTLSNMDRGYAATDVGFSLDLDAALSGLHVVSAAQSDVCGAGSTLSGSGSLTLASGAIEPLTECSFSVEIAVPPSAAGGYYPLQSSAVSATLDQAQYMGTPAADELQVAYAPTLSATTSDDPALPGDVITLSITIANTDPSNALSAVTFVQDLDQWLPGGVIQSLPANGACGGGSTFSQVSGTTHYWQMMSGNLAAGDSCTFEVGLLVPSDAPPATATFAPETFQGTLDSRVVQGRVTPRSVTLLAAPHLDLSLAPGPFAGGDEAELSVELEYPDQASAGAQSLAFELDLEAALAGLRATGLPMNDVCGTGSQLSGSANVALSGGSLEPGERCSFVVTLLLPADPPGGDYALSTSLSAMVAGRAISGLSRSATLRVRRAVLLALSAQGPVSPGDSLRFEYQLTNAGASDFDSLAFTHQPGAALSGLAPLGLPVTDPCGAGSSLSAAAATGFSLNAGSLAAGTSCTFAVDFLVPADALSGSYTTATSALAGTPVGGSAESFGPASTNFEVQPALSFTSAFDRSAASLGDSVTLQLTLGNRSQSQSVSGLTFDDDLDAALSGLSALGLPASDVCGAGSQLSGSSALTLTGASLGAGETCTIPVTLQLPADAVQDALVNTTGALSGSASVAGSVDAPATSAALQLLRASFALQQDGSAVAGQQATLELTLTNVGAHNALDQVSWQLDLGAYFPGLSAVGLPRAGLCGAASSLSGSQVVQLREARLEPAASCTLALPVLIPLDAPRGATTGPSGSLRLGAGPTIPGPDSTLTVSSPPPGFARQVSPAQLRVGDAVVLTYTVDNTANPALVGALAFGDSLPGGVSFSDPPSSDNACGGTLTLDADSATISLAGGSVAASARCTLEVSLVATGAGTQEFGAISLHSDAGETPIAKTSLTVGAAPPADQADAGTRDAGAGAAGSSSPGGQLDAGVTNDGGAGSSAPAERDAGETNPSRDAGAQGDAGLGADAGAVASLSGGGCGCRIAEHRDRAHADTRWLGACGLLLIMGWRRVRRARTNSVRGSR